MEQSQRFIHKKIKGEADGPHYKSRVKSGRINSFWSTCGIHCVIQVTVQCPVNILIEYERAGKRSRDYKQTLRQRRDRLSKQTNLLWRR